MTYIKRMFDKLLRHVSCMRSRVILIHVGKCGGSTIRTALVKHGSNFHVQHVRRTRYSPRKKYIIVLRNPITRFISAFNWRYKLVVDDGAQTNRFKGEKEVLKQYKTVNSLAEAIYDENGVQTLDFSTHRPYVHHLTEDIYFHIGDILDACAPQDIVAVIATETLEKDLKDFFSIESKAHEKNNTGCYDTLLSDRAHANLKRYLHKDYECIAKLNELGVLSKEKYDMLSK